MHWCGRETADEDAAFLRLWTSGAASSVLFVGSVWPVYCVATSESVSNLCLCFQTRVSAVSHQGRASAVIQQLQSVSPVPQSLSSPAGASCQSVKINRTGSLFILNSHKIPVLRHNRNFNIATAQSPREAIQVFIKITEICSSDTHLCSSRIYVEY